MFVILVLMIIALVLPFFLVRHRNQRAFLALSLVLETVFLAVILWYFIPTELDIAQGDELSMSISFAEGIVLPDHAQTAELQTLLADLRIRRRFFNGYNQIGNTVMRSNIPADEYIYLNCSDGEGRHIGLHLGAGYDCYTDNGDSILNPNALVSYLLALFP